MKVLILTCNTGGGHHAAAASLEEAFEKLGVECEVEDVLLFISENVSKVFGKAHNLMYRHAPAIFNAGYAFSEQHPEIFQERSGIHRFLEAGDERLADFIEKGGYDAIVCTHVFSAMIVNDTMKYRNLSLRTAYVATDYTCHPGAEESEMDWYFIPADSLLEEFVQKGIPREKLVVTGIPVSSRFAVHVPREEAKKANGIRPEQKHLLMMCGSMGCGPMKELAEQLAERLKKDMVLTVLCGTNEFLYRRLTRKFADNDQVRVLGYTREVPQLMDSADLYLTKAGGLSTSEAMAKNLPMCFIQAVEGCEEHNIDYFVGKGLAITGDEEELPGLCIRLLGDEGRLELMRERLRQAYMGNAADAIAKHMINGD